MTIKRTLLISLACGVVAVILAAIYLHKKEQMITGGGELKRVLVATVDIGAATLIEPGMVKVVKAPRAYVQPAAITVVEGIQGRVTAAPIKRGEQILGTKLVMGGPESGLSSKIGDGKRAVAVAVDDITGVGGFIRPDDFVDVVALFDYGDRDQSNKIVYTLFQRVPVLAVGSKMVSVRKPTGVAVVERKNDGMFGIKNLSGHKKSSHVTLELGLDEVQDLIFAQENGLVTLALRPPTDKTIYPELAPASIGTVTGRHGLLLRRKRPLYKEYRGPR